MVQPYKYLDIVTKKRFTSIKAAVAHSGLSVNQFKAYFGSPGFPYKRIVTPRAGGGMGLFGTTPKARRRPRA